MSSPAHIIIYASDHGFGHAARMFALAARLAEEGRAVTLCAGAALPMIRAALPGLSRPIDVTYASLDPGLVALAGALDFDLDRSRDALAAWLSALPLLVDTEAARLSRLGASLVIADVPAAAILAASRASVPAVVCSNFDWLDMYAGRFGSAIDDTLAEAYSFARFGIRPALGRLPLQGVRRVVDVDGLLARKPARPRENVRRELGLSEQDLVIGLGLGGSLDPDLYEKLGASSQDADVHLLAPRRADATNSGSNRLVYFPSITADPQSYFGACDLVLAKAGYSTLAEAGMAWVPLAAFPLRKSPESVALARDVETLGLGVALEDEPSAFRALARPRDLIERATSAIRGVLSDGAPAVCRILAREGLL